MEATGDAPISRFPKIGDRLDPRIGAGVKSLVQAGYFSVSDFGWMALYLPEEYADDLQTPVSAAPVCG